MHPANNDLYDEKAIKDAEKRTERYKSGKSMKEVKHFINSRLFKDLDFPPDEDELDDGITEF
jgi:hypothetical protein